MDNNVCLAIQHILVEHPEAECPLDPLLETIDRRQWRSQQKGAQALYYALKEPAMKERAEELCRPLIPLLISQRPRVYGAALDCLKKITGHDAGPDPEAWKKHYEEKFPGWTLDLTGAMYELLVIVRPLGDAPPLAYEVNGEEVKDAMNPEMSVLGEVTVSPESDAFRGPYRPPEAVKE